MFYKCQEIKKSLIFVDIAAGCGRMERLFFSFVTWYQQIGPLDTRWLELETKTKGLFSLFLLLSFL